MPISRLSRMMIFSISSTIEGWMPSLGSSSSTARSVEVGHQIWEKFRYECWNFTFAVGTRKSTHQDVFADAEIRDDLPALGDIGDTRPRSHMRRRR